MRVVVVGAGFAGLAAATELAARGIEVVVLEARDRVGGRVWSDRLNGAVIERGAEFVLEGYETMRSLAARHGLAFADTGMSYYVREPRGVDATTEAVQAAGIALAQARGDGSVAAAVAAAGLPEAVAEAVLARVEISAALEADRLGAEVLQHAAAFEPLPSHRLAAGNQALADALAADLDVRLRTAVRAVEDGCVQTDDGELDADRVVVALPLPIVRALALPGWKRDALDRVPVGHAAKLHVGLARPAPPSAVMSVPDRFWCWTTPVGEGVVHCFAGSPGALERLGSATWPARVAAVCPEFELTDDAVLTTWSDDPWALGAYSTGELAEDAALTAPVGGIHFAGEYTAGAWSGLMEGALRSGIRAAREIS